MTKQGILDHFKDINEAYNDCTRLESLSRMLDELLESIPQIIRCLDCKHRGEIECPMTEGTEDGTLIDYLDNDWFCADGEPKEGDGDG